MDEHILKIRSEYSRASLDASDTAALPSEQFEKWFSDALDAKLPEPNAMLLSTVGSNGRPSARIVLFRGGLPDGFMFFTNYRSRKGRDLSQNTYAAITFFWPELERQIRIEGKVEPTVQDVSDNYFAQRPRGSQIGAWASPQSQEISTRNELSDREAELEKTFDGKEVNRPPHWGGNLLRPDYYEFWQGRPNRLHDRICYRLENNVWRKFRIAP